MDESSSTGPDAMITATETALVEAGVPADRGAYRTLHRRPAGRRQAGGCGDRRSDLNPGGQDITLTTVVLDGKGL